MKYETIWGFNGGSLIHLSDLTLVKRVKCRTIVFFAVISCMFLMLHAASGIILCFNMARVRKFDFYVDKITNSIENAVTSDTAETEIFPLLATDLKMTLKKYGWKFNWREEFRVSGRQVYKLVVQGEVIIEGLISLQAMEAHIEMHLIESAPHNFGRSKKWIGVPGNLVAFACRMSFETGFDGAVGFMAKTRLIQHYIDKFGAVLIYGNRMGILGNSARKLVNSYYKNYRHDG